MITILKFNSEQEAQEKLSYYNDLARHKTNSEDFSLTLIHKHLELDFYWLNGSECLAHSGSGRESILDDMQDQLIENFDNREELITNGYLSEIGVMSDE